MDRDTATIDLELASTVEGKPIVIRNSQLKDVKIEQQFETSITISNEGPHLDLVDWKHATSEWMEIKKTNSYQYLTRKFSDYDRTDFPYFTEDELYQYLIDMGRHGWAKLIKEPLYSNGQKHYQVSVSKVRFRIKGINDEGKSVEKTIVVNVPMGC